MEAILKKLEEHFQKEIRSFSISFYDNGKKFIRVTYYCQKSEDYSYWKEISCTPNEVATGFEGSDGDSWGLDHQEDDGATFNKLSEIIFE